jgi:nifR3 family TIM-barrel protein
VIVILSQVSYNALMLRIGHLGLENFVIMAPMAGITNLPFRLMVKKLGAGLVTTEMVSAMGLTLGKKKTHEYLRSDPREKPLAVQIFGSSPEVMAGAARKAIDAGAQLLDINMGCPVKKVVKTGAGASLLRDEKSVAAIVSAVRRVCPIPLTVKIRAGWSPDKPVAGEIAHVVEDCGGDAITIHPRFATQSYSVRADWRLIGQVKERVKIPVIGNGDIFQPFQALQMMRQTGCDGVMVGRGAIGNPWIFKQILHLARGLPVPRPGLEERRSLLLEHYQLLSDAMGGKRAARAMRGLLLWYTKGLPHSSRFRGSITQIKDLESMVTTMNAYFSTLKDEQI